MSKQARRKSGFPFSVAVEFLAGLVGIYGIGRLFARRFKEARIFLIVSLLLILPLDLTPRLLLGDEYALWLPWVVKGVLAALSALHLHLVLSRARRGSRS
ncbi:MAG: hypothetical protein ACYC5O_06240 [Anaerolineae bacterium]